MKNSMHKMFIIATASAAIASTSAFAQGAPDPDNGPTTVNGTLRIAAPSVINKTNADAAYLESAVTVAATLQQIQLISFTVANNKETTKTGFKKYAYGNKEILQAALETTNNPSGYRLVQEETLTNEDQELWAVGKTNSFPAVDFSYSETPGERALVGTTVVTNGDVSSDSKTGVSAFNANLADGTYENIPGTANVTLNLRSVKLGTGTNAVTTPYYASTVNGTFSAVVPSAD